MMKMIIYSDWNRDKKVSTHQREDFCISWLAVNFLYRNDCYQEYIFEDFFAGFLPTKFHHEWKVEYQKSNEYLSNDPRVFRMQHDIFLTSKDRTNRQIIIDTKYKLREQDFKSDPKKGVSQGDIYQMVSYAFKRGVRDIILVYPNVSEVLHSLDEFKIISGFDEKLEISITALEIPFWSVDDFSALDKKLFAAIETVLHRA